MHVQNMIKQGLVFYFCKKEILD